MVRSILFSSLLLGLLSLVQSTWLGPIAVLGVAPDLGLLALVWISYRNGLVEGPAAGFLSGFAEDAMSSAPLGFNAFVKTLVAWAAASLHGSFYIDRIFLPLLLGASATLLKALGTGLLALVFEERVLAYDFLDKALWIEAAYNGLLAPLFFLLLGILKPLLMTERSRP